MSPKYYPMLYYVKERDLARRRFESQIHRIRDGLALTELGALVLDAGYAYGGAILNVPLKFQRQLAAEGQLREYTPRIGSADMVLLATRPALDDDEEADERPLVRSGSGIEKAAFAVLRRFFTTCERSEVILSKDVILEEPYEYFRAIHFRQNQGGRVRFFDTENGELEPDDPRRTVGYLVCMPQMTQQGTRLMAVFGMGGAETLWLCHLLRTRLADEFHKAVTTPVPRISLISFLVPAYAPFPFLHCEPAELRPQVLLAKLAH